jgi:hypothetical protein
MIQNRVQGLSNLVTACQCFLALVLFWIWIALYQAFIPSSGLVSYAGYSFLVVIGLWLESVFRDPSLCDINSELATIVETNRCGVVARSGVRFQK